MSPILLIAFRMLSRPVGRKLAYYAAMALGFTLGLNLWLNLLNIIGAFTWYRD